MEMTDSESLFLSLILSSGAKDVAFCAVAFIARYKRERNLCLK